MSDYAQFIGLNSLLFVVIVLVSLLIGGILRKYNFHYLPESSAIMIFGFVVGCFLLLFPEQEQSVAQFHPELFFFVLLPPIIFDAGYTLKRKDFFTNIGSISMYAVVGTLISAFVFGYLLWGIALLGWIPLTTELECLLYGALISSTDPVATLSMLKDRSVNADPLLYSLVFGESVLNDAIAIVLFKTFHALIQDGVTSLDAETMFKALGIFLGVSIGSICVGVGIALLCCMIFKRIDFSLYPVYEFTLVLLFAYCSYFLAEIIQLSGIMSLFFCSVCLAHYNFYNISRSARIATKDAFTSLAQISETFVFAYIGITAGISIQSSSLQWSPLLVVFSIIFIFVSRFFNIFPLSFLLNIKRTVKIPVRMMIPMWFAGLRGAVAFALSLNFPALSDTVSHTGYIITSTLCVVIFTTLVCGPFTLPVLVKTKMSGSDITQELLSQRAQNEMYEIRSADVDPTPSVEENGGGEVPIAGKANDQYVLLDRRTERTSSSAKKIKSVELLQPPNSYFRRIVYYWKRFDKLVMRRWFGDKYRVLQYLELKKKRKRRIREQLERERARQLRLQNGNGDDHEESQGEHSQSKKGENDDDVDALVHETFPRDIEPELLAAVEEDEDDDDEELERERLEREQRRREQRRRARENRFTPPAVRAPIPELTSHQRNISTSVASVSDMVSPTSVLSTSSSTSSVTSITSAPSVLSSRIYTTGHVDPSTGIHPSNYAATPHSTLSISSNDSTHPTPNGANGNGNGNGPLTV